MAEPDWESKWWPRCDLRRRLCSSCRAFSSLICSCLYRIAFRIALSISSVESCSSKEVTRLSALWPPQMFWA